MATFNSQELLQLYRHGNSEAATAIFDRYVARLVALARSRISSKLQPRIDPEDVVQSAYRSFFLHARAGDYELAQSGDLWRLLASIALHKLHRQIERHTAAKRNINREEPAGGTSLNLSSPEPTAAEVVALAEELHFVVDQLTSDEREVLEATLQGRAMAEICSSLGKSERTVRRLVSHVKQKIEERLLDQAAVTSQPSRPDIEILAPLRYSDFVLEQLLGSGGMGKVFRARDKRTGKEVAIKALHKSRQADPRATARFVQEAQILETLRHPNIVDIQGLGRFPGGGLFIAMDYVDGVDLQTQVQRGPLPVCEVIRITRQIAAAVQHAHDHGIVHCDLKPGNVLLDTSGNAFVTDFGFAHLISATNKQSTSGIGGTPGYIAPEVLSRRGTPTPGADIYALGMLMWTLATGNTPDTYSSHQGVADNSTAFDEICRRCLANSCEQRYRSARELSEHLSRL